MNKYCLFTIATILVSNSAFARDADQNAIQGSGYLASRAVCLNSPSFVKVSYKMGDPEWEKKNQEWLESECDDPYPEDLKDIEGGGYLDSRGCHEFFPGDLIDDDDDGY